MKTLRLFAIGTLFLLLLIGCNTSEETTVEPTKITFALGYLHNVQFAPLYLAAEKGYFAEEGIEIEFAPIFEDESLTKISSNELQFGMSSGDQVLLARERGLPMVYVAGYYQQAPIAIVARHSLGLATPADLAGQTVALPGLFGVSYLGTLAILQAGGVAEGDVILNQIGFTQMDSFEKGESDVIVVFVNNELVRLENAGEAVTVFKVEDYIQLVSSGLVTNEETIENNPDLVRGMVAAITRGMSDAIADPDAAYEAAKKYVPELTTADNAETAVQKEVLSDSLLLMVAEPLGETNPQAWENTLDLLITMGMFSTRPDVEKAYTNEFLPES